MPPNNREEKESIPQCYQQWTTDKKPEHQIVYYNTFFPKSTLIVFKKFSLFKPVATHAKTSACMYTRLPHSPT